MEVVQVKMGVGNLYGLRQRAAELVFSNLSEAIAVDKIYNLL